MVENTCPLLEISYEKPCKLGHIIYMISELIYMQLIYMQLIVFESSFHLNLGFYRNLFALVLDIMILCSGFQLQFSRKHCPERSNIYVQDHSIYCGETLKLSYILVLITV